MSKKTGDVELAKKDDKKNDEEESDSEEDGTHQEGHVPLLVFLWTFKPWDLYGHLIPLFLTHAIIICSAGVFMCQAGFGAIACTANGLTGFIMGIMALLKIQMYGNLKLSSERMQQELNKMKALMGQYETENRVLKETLVKLEEQSVALNAQSNRLERFTNTLDLSTTDFENGVQDFRRERLELNKTFNEINKIVETLTQKEVNLQDRCAILRRELKKLRAHNKIIAKTYNNLVEEHEGVRQTNDQLAEQIKKFDIMRQRFIDQRDVLKDSMDGNLTGLHSMMENYEIMFLQEIAHNTEFLDGKAGMTGEKFDEFLQRIPSNMQIPEDKLITLFEELANEDNVCDHEAMHHIIIQIVKANTGISGPLTVEGNIEAKLDSAKVDL